MTLPDGDTPLPGIPTGARLVQLRKRRKQPLAGKGETVVAVLAENFKPLQGHNVGIFLDGMFIVVDADDFSHPHLLNFLERLPVTWTQTTPKGRHYLYRVPVGYQGTNLDKSHLGWGDIKTKGYIVAPGCAVDDAGPGHPAGSYVLQDARDPSPAPDWLLEMAREKGPSEAQERDGEERDRILDGERDNTLTAIAGALRRQGFAESALAAMLGAIVDSGVVEQPPGREVTAEDIERIARSIARKPVGPTDPKLVLIPKGWEVAENISLDEQVTGWIMPGFIPAVGLAIVYGDGKIGKSSWAAYLAAQETKKGKRVIFIPSGEETFQQFVRKAHLSGAVLGNIICYPAEANFMLPKSVEHLAEGIDFWTGTSLIYIDALYSHFSDTPGLHAGERARHNLKALAQMAIDKQVCVLGTIHENVTGGMMGSREMRNVARALVHAKRNPGGDFTVWSKGTNSVACDYGVSFPGVAVPSLDSSGKPIVFVDLFGTEIPQATWVLRQGEKVGQDDSTITVDQITVSPKDQISAYLLDNPNDSNRQIAEALGIPKGTVDRYAAQIRASSLTASPS